VFASFDYTSFFNVWYWVLTIATWTQVCHRTLGVPYDMILRAERCRAWRRRSTPSPASPRPASPRSTAPSAR
jgi:hypothetical protein